jgi:serine/threonine-protein kinase
VRDRVPGDGQAAGPPADAGPAGLLARAERLRARRAEALDAQRGGDAEAAARLWALLIPALAEFYGPDGWPTEHSCVQLGGLPTAGSERTRTAEELQRQYGPRRTRRARRALAGRRIALR